MCKGIPEFCSLIVNACVVVEYLVEACVVVEFL
jgi:hypothetical protein